MAKKRGQRRAAVIQVAVPTDLIGKVKGAKGQPVRKIEVPLGPNATKADRAGKLAEIHRRFESIRAGLPLPDADLEHIAEEEHRRAFDYLSARYLDYHGKLGELEVEIALQGVLLGSEEANPLLNGVTTTAYATARLRRLGREPTKESVTSLADAILRAQSAAVEMIKTGRTPPPLPGKPVIRSAARTGIAPHVSELVESHLAGRVKLKDKTRNQARTSIQMFADFADDPRVDAIDRATVSAWASDRDSKGDAAATVNKHVSMVGKFWQWAQDKVHVEEGAPNPFLRHRRELDPESTWQPFTTAELQKLLQPSTVRWHMIIALFSGLRDSELVGAKLKKHGGRHYFEVTGGKTKAARRNVPVHPTLIKLGMAEEWPRFNKLSASVVSKRFTRWRKSQRVNRDRVAFHSLRKNFTESLENAHVSTNLVAALLGHSRGFSLDVYNPAGPEFKMLADAVAKVSYKGLKLA